MHPSRSRRHPGSTSQPPQRTPRKGQRRKFCPLSLEALESRIVLDVAGQRYAGQLYQDLLGRTASAAELMIWGTIQDQGATRTQVASQIEGSNEYLSDVVQGLYNQFLHRDADPGGLSTFVASLSAGGTIEQAEALLVGSGEYFQTRASSTNDGFLDALYQDALTRTVDPSGRAAFDQALAGGTTRTQVAAAIFASTEFRQDLVQSDYQKYLHRAADPGGLNAFVTALQNGARDQDVVAALAGSDEYYTTRVDARGTPNEVFVKQTYLDVMSRTADASGLAKFTSFLDQGGSRAQAVQLLTGSQEYRTTLVNGLYNQLLHRVADTVGVNTFVALLSNGGTDEQVQALLAGSGEYFQNRGGGTNDGFLNALYQDALNRAVDSAGRLAFDQQLATGMTRTQVATEIFTSGEYRQDLVQSFYQRFLHRTADAGGLAAFVGALQNGTSDEAVIVDIVSSQEYFDRANSPSTAPAIVIQSPASGTTLFGNVTVTGTVTGNSAPMTSLIASVDSGIFVNVSFDAGGHFAFPTTFALDGTADGMHVITFEATDNFDGIASATISLTLDTRPHVVSSVPANGDTDVLPTQFVTVTFSKPVHLAPPSGDSHTAISVSAGGAAIPGRVQLDDTGTRLMFIPASSLPMGVQVTATVDSTQIFDAAGNPLVALPAQSAFAFQTAPGTPVPGTKVIGFVFDSTPGAGGVNVPLAGAQVKLANDPGLQTVTDANGRFELDNTPAGKLLVQVNGLTVAAPAGMFYPQVAELLQAIPGESNQFQAPIFLPLAKDQDLVNLSTTSMTAVTNPTLLPGWTLMVPPNATMRQDGTFGTQMLLAAVPPTRLPAPLPPGFHPAVVITIQTPGGADIFLQPVPLTAPNLDHLPPGTKTELWDFDHSRGAFFPSALATVSADGLTVTTDPGQGVLQPGWHFFAPPPPPPPPPPVDPPDSSPVDGGARLSGNNSLSTRQALDNAAQQLLASFTQTASDLAGLSAELAPLAAVVSAGLGVAQSSLSASNPTPATITGLLESQLGIATSNASTLNTLAQGLTSFGQAIQNGNYTSANSLLQGVTQNFDKLAPFLTLPALGLDLQTLGTDVNNFKALAVAIPGNRSAQLTQAFSVALSGVGTVVTDLGKVFEGIAGGFTALVQTAIAVQGLPPTTPLPSAVVTQVDGLDQTAEQQLTPALQLLQGSMPNEVSSAQTVLATSQNTFARTDPNRVYYKFVTSTGVVSRGSGIGGRTTLFGQPGDTGTLTWADPIQKTIGSVQLTFPAVGSVGASFQFPPLFLDPSTALDTSGNGLPDDISAVLADTPPSKQEVANILAGLDPAEIGLAINGLIGEVATPAVDVAAGNGVAYVAAGNSGFQVIDISRPSAPTIIGQAATTAPAGHVNAQGNRAAVAESDGTVEVFDVSQPTAPQRIFSTSTGAAGTFGVLGAGYVIVNQGVILESFEPFAGVQVGQFTLPGSGVVEALYYTNGVVYAVRHDTTAQTFTLVSAALNANGSLTQLGELQFAGLDLTPNSLARLSGGEGVLFISAVSTNTANTNPGFVTVNISNPANLSLIANATPDAVSAMAEDGSGLAITGTRVSGFSAPILDVFNVSNPSNTGAIIATIPVPGQVTAVAVDGGLGLAVDGGELDVVRFAQPGASPQPPTVSITTPAGKLAVTAGQTITVHVKAASAGAQVARVELLLQGTNVVATLTSFPYDATFVVPAGIPVGTILTLAARASDTTGLITVSSPVTLTVTADTTAPTVLHTTPAANAMGVNVASIQVVFSKSINPLLVNLAGITLTSTGSTTPVALASATVFQNRVLTIVPQLPLSAGPYQLTINPAIIADNSGNSLAAPFTLNFTSTNVAATDFWISTTSGAWNNPSNWSTGFVPGPNDIVFIDQPGAPTVTVPVGNFTVKSLDSRVPLVISGGTLTVTGGVSRAESSLTLINGGTLTASGAGTSFIGTGTTSVSGGNLAATNGGVMNLPNLASLVATANTFTTVINAVGIGSQVNLPNLTALSGASAGAVVQFLSQAGGSIDLHAVTQMSSGAVQFRAFDPTSVIDLTSLANFSATTPNATLEAHNGGTVKTPNLVATSNFGLTLDGAASAVNTSQFTNVNTLNVAAQNGAVINLTGVHSMAGNTFNTFLNASGAGSRINLPNLTTVTGGTGGAVIQFQVQTGGFIDLHALPQMTSGAVQFRAFDPGSVFDATGLTNFTATTANASLEAHNGATVKTPNLTTTVGFGLTVDGAASTLSTSQFTNIHTLNVAAQHGGVINLSGVHSMTGNTFNTFLNASGAGSQINLPNLTTLTGGTGGAVIQFQVQTGGSIDLHTLTQMTSGAVQFRAFDPGSVLDLSALTNFSATTSNALLEAHNGGTVKVPNLVTTAGFGLTIDGAASTLSTSQFSNINTLNVSAQNGGIVNLSGVTSMAGNTFNTFLSASGAGSQINLPNLSTVTGGSGGAVIQFQVQTGGLIDLHTLTQMTSGAVQFRSFDPNSIIDLSALTHFVATTGNATLEAHNGALVKVPNLTTTAGFGLTIDGAASAINTSQFTNINTLNVAAQNGGVINLSGVHSMAGNSFNTFLNASGAGSLINLPNLTTLTGGSGAAVIQFQVQTGGLIDLHALTQVTTGAVQFRAFDPGSVIDLTALTKFSATTQNATLEAHNSALVKVPNLTTTAGFSLTVDGAASTLSTSQFTNVDTVPVLAQNGAVISFSGVVGLSGNSSFSVSYTATGAGSQVNFPNLTTLTGGSNFAVVQFVSQLGGSVDLHAVTHMTSGAVQFRASDPNSAIDLTALTNFTATAQNATLEAHNGAAIKVPNLTTTGGFVLTVDGATSAINTSQFTNIDTLSVSAQNGAVINLSGVTSMTGNGNNTSLTANGIGSQVLLPHLTSLVGANNFAVTRFTSQAGGFIDLHALTQMTSGSVQFQAFDANSVIDLMALTNFSATAPNASLEARNGGTVRLALGTVTVSGVPLVLSSGTFTVGTLLVSSGSVLSGSGALTGNLTNGGTIDPGGQGAAGTITVSGNYTQTAAGVLNLDIGGTTAGSQFDQLSIGGIATLAGTLNLAVINGFAPSVADTFAILLYASASGTFGTVTGTNTGNGHVFLVNVHATSATLTVM